MGIEDDLFLLRAYEPVVRFTEGEWFFPVSVDRYVSRAGLWRAEPGASPVQVARPGELTLDRLATAGGAEQGLRYSLSGIGGDTTHHAHIPLRERPPHLARASRLAQVGLTARLVDAMNRFSLLFRGSVPGGSAAHSFLLQRDHLEPHRPTYYGRVFREEPWIVLQYWFFYSFNNWRSAFGGVNEHEGDWEQVTVYLDGTGVIDQDGLPPARWVVFSAHDEVGDDLRRRWDDPDLAVAEDRHPVVFSGAGSHSGAYLPGDYLITVRPPKLRGLVRALRWSARLLAPWSGEDRQTLGIPYVDYARGDGRAIGPGHDEGWHPVLIGDDTPWVRDFRGLWGRDTRDRLGGERGPAGPRYSRDGTVRQAWADPVGWAGLSKVVPNQAAERQLAEIRARRNDERLDTLDREIDALRHDLAVSAAGLPAGAPEVRALAADEQRLLALRMERTRLADEQSRMATVWPVVEDPHAHLLHRRLPMETATGLLGRARSWWAVLSTPLILWALGAVVSPLPIAGKQTALILLLTLLTVEGLVRQKFWAVLLRLLLAFVALLLLALLWLDGRYLVNFAFFAAALLVLLVNIREAWRR
ncbi:hypothetical protein ACWT_2854 [Actinoplanes sp. SE50]|uniref:hypothetical protein n=1 Tax=unclassified Actinoplanes TaxID=2626549 RepID=UPI00023EC42B|nr:MULTISPECIES: hypothetical protein [unclassified Actinoplanes]AEV83587.1 hypothetical protein ACPL_2692 [Actinoplanes sp. SE50/110]ATO82269.1 hypothetical protein ACWT_2854 [Actinoplanes sp. SE50]SLL99676.1 hypothetical protein ACSP50_2907 [Actinoplanes sp. SE50/110]